MSVFQTQNDIQQQDYKLSLFNQELLKNFNITKDEKSFENFCKNVQLQGLESSQTLFSLLNNLHDKTKQKDDVISYSQIREINRKYKYSGDTKAQVSQLSQKSPSQSLQNQTKITNLFNQQVVNFSETSPVYFNGVYSETRKQDNGELKKIKKPMKITCKKYQAQVITIIDILPKSLKQLNQITNSFNKSQSLFQQQQSRNTQNILRNKNEIQQANATNENINPLESISNPTNQHKQDLQFDSRNQIEIEQVTSEYQPNIVYASNLKQPGRNSFNNSNKKVVIRRPNQNATFQSVNSKRLQEIDEGEVRGRQESQSMHIINNPETYDVDNREMSKEERNLELLNRSLLSFKHIINEIEQTIEKKLNDQQERDLSDINLFKVQVQLLKRKIVNYHEFFEKEFKQKYKQFNQKNDDLDEIQVQEFQILPILNEISETMKYTCKQQNNVKFKLNNHISDMICNNNCRMIKQTIYNFIDNSVNALRKDGGQIQLTCSKNVEDSNIIDFVITDTGPGLQGEPQGIGMIVNEILLGRLGPKENLKIQSNTQHKVKINFQMYRNLLITDKYIKNLNTDNINNDPDVRSKRQSSYYQNQLGDSDSNIKQNIYESKSVFFLNLNSNLQQSEKTVVISKKF